MRRALIWLVAISLAVIGLLGITGYAVALILTDDRVMLTRDYGSLFAFSVVGTVAGVIAILALARRIPPTWKLPNEWVAFSVFAVAIATGFGALFFDQVVVVSPVLALIAAAALFVFIGRLVTKWSPERRVGARAFVLPAVWGAIGAPLTAGLAQILTVVMLVAGAATGIYLSDETLIDDIDSWASEVSESSDLSVIETPTVSFAAIAVLGITAPLTEELTKFLGVYLLFRKRVATKYGLFIAGAASGLGFAVVESLGYALMTADTWPQIMLLRAPVALIHVAATTIVALGWYRHRQQGGWALVGYFALAVLLHAAWNSLFVSMMITAAGLDTADAVDPAAGMVVLALVGAMGVTLVASVFWIVGHARGLGGPARPMTDAYVAEPSLSAFAVRS